MSIEKRTARNGRTIRWRVQLYDPALGRKVTVGTRATKTEARQLERDALADRELPSPSTTTVSQWRDMWMRTSQVKASTRRWHEERTRAFNAEHGDRLVSAFTRGAAVLWAADHRSTVLALSAMWTAAVKAEVTTANPWHGLAPIYRRRLEPGWITAQDVEHFLRCAELAWPGEYGQLVAAMISMAAYAGLRPGELAGLRWVDLSPTTGRLHVRRQAETKTRSFTSPKNGQERQVVYAPAIQERVALMPRLHDELVFVGPGEGVMWGSVRDRVWRGVAQRAGRPETTLHELRHWCATWLMEQGMPSSDVAIQLGQTDGGRLVESTYSHHRADPALDRLAAVLADVGRPTTEAEEAAS